MPLAISGSLPKFWDWLGKATDAGKSQYMDTIVEVWAGRDDVSAYKFNPLNLVSINYVISCPS